ncbi:aldo/keto reductase [Amycolatopsis silviterrae]|uniref:Aldo/keto reductase n=1 Tax=Amycolatopsis silviterrae TaxID=1656914 RepID=A0ABW5H2U7_9PSEU
MTETDRPAAASGVVLLGGDLPVHQLGFGAMRVTGPGVWGPPADREEARAVVRRAVELGVDLIDTAEVYGPHVSEEIIREALHPYPSGLVIATKGGIHRPSADTLVPNGRPEFLRAGVEGSLARLRVETIDLYQLHRVDPDVPVEDSVGALAELRAEGKIRHIGLSEVGVAELRRAGSAAPIASVQNRYNVADREHEAVLDYCEQEGIGFLPWFPLNTGDLAVSGGPLADLAARTGLAPAQLALAWLLHRSPVMAAIPGTGSLAHLEQNCAAGAVRLDDEIYAALSAMTPPAA